MSESVWERLRAYKKYMGFDAQQHTDGYKLMTEAIEHGEELERALARETRLREFRDGFIVEHGLWEQFEATCRARALLEKGQQP